MNTPNVNRIINRFLDSEVKVEKSELTYDDVITYNHNYYEKELGYKGYGDGLKIKTLSFHLKKSEGKRAEFYNPNHTLFLNQTDFFSIDKYDKYEEEKLPNDDIIERHLVRNKVEEKKYIVLKFERANVKYNYHNNANDFIDGYTLYDFLKKDDDAFLRKIEDNYLPKNFGRIGFFDEVDGKLVYVFVKKDVLYNPNLPLVKTIFAYTNDVIKEERKCNVELLDVILPNELIKRNDWRDLEKKVESHKNGTNEIEISMGEIYDRTISKMEKQFNDKSKETINSYCKSTLGECFDFDNQYKTIGAIQPFRIMKEGIEYVYDRNTYDLGFDETLNYTSEEKLKTVEEKITERLSESIKGVEDWKKDSLSTIEDQIATLTKMKGSIETDTKLIKKNIKNMEVVFDETQLKDVTIDNIINYLPTDTDFLNIGEFLVGKHRYCNKPNGILNALPINILKKLRTKGSVEVKKLLKGSKISDVSKDRNWSKEPIELEYSSTPNKFLRRFYENYLCESIDSEDRMYDFLTNGSLNLSTYLKEKLIRFFISELKNLITNENADLHKDLDEGIAYLQSLISDKGHFTENKSVLNVGVIDPKTENSEILKYFKTINEKVVEYFEDEGALLSIPTQPKEELKEVA